MGRVRQNEPAYAKQCFQKEIQRRQGEYGVMSVRALAQLAGIPSSTLHDRLNEPDKLDVTQLRRLVAAIQPDPRSVLALIGYDAKTIRRALAQHAALMGEEGGEEV